MIIMIMMIMVIIWIIATKFFVAQMRVIKKCLKLNANKQPKRLIKVTTYINKSYNIY